MFLNLKLGNKVILAFIFLVAITSFVCYSGYNGMTNIMKENNDITKIFLPSVKSILELQFAQTTVMVDVRGLINRKMTADSESIKAKIGNLGNAFKEAETAWKIYEPLLKAERETKVWNEFIPKWNEWKKGVDEIKSFISEKEKLMVSGVKLDDARIVELDDKAFNASIECGKFDEDIDKLLGEIAEINEQAAADSVKKIGAAFESSKTSMFNALGFGIFVALIIGGVLSKNIKNIVTGLIEEAKKLTEAAVDGKLDIRGDLNKINFEFRGVIEGVNKTLDAVIRPLNVAAEYVDRISKGDVPQKITDDYKGDFNEIKNNINNLIDNLDNFTLAMNKMYEEQKAGDIDYYMDDKKFIGVYQKMASGVNGSVKLHVDNILKILGIVSSYGVEADFSQTLEKLPGKQIVANQIVDSLKDNLKNIVEEVSSLAGAATNGNLSVRGNASKFKGGFREIVSGMNSTLDSVIKPVEEAAVCLEEMAKGNLDVYVKGDYAGDHAKIKVALNTTIDSMNEILSHVSVAVEQVNTGSRQVSDASQSLSQTATESASSLEEIGASMHEISSQARQNAENATQANGLASNVKKSADEGNDKMGDMQKAMTAINESASNVAKIIKAIDEIAFQTNLLALNAAVEAARAGKHGKGFTVVAEEVRNLAQRSAKAAKETAEMIESSIKKTEAGSRIADETARALGEIVTGVTKVTDLVGEIASASKEQEQGVKQVNAGIAQVDQVTQQNTATAEEAAAASEELSAQATELKAMLERFRLKKTSGTVNAYVSNIAAKVAAGKAAELKSGLKHSNLRVASKQNADKIKVASGAGQRPSDIISLDDREFGNF